MSTDTKKRIVFTGGSGKAGRHALPYLLDKGYKVLNADLVPHPVEGVSNRKVDLTDSGQVFNVLSSHFNFDDYANPYQKDGSPVAPIDAVIHFGAYANDLLASSSELFQANVRGTYNVIEAACKLGIKKVIIASSETVYGVCFNQGAEGEFDFFPLDEDKYDVNPSDSYALSKVCGEKIARGFARRFPDVDIYALRIGNVIEPHEYARDFPKYLEDPALRKRNAWSYIDARDLGQICHLCVQKSGLGFQIFNATNSTITTQQTTAEILSKYSPTAKVTREMGKYEAPLTNRKIREVLGFEDEHPWAQYVGNNKS